MPLHVIGQHGKEDMRLHALLQPVADRADVQVHALERAESALHFGQAFVVQDGGFGAHLGLGDGGADHIEAVERRFGGDALFIDAEGEGRMLDIEIEVLFHLVLADDLASAQADLIAPGEPAGGDPVRDFLKRALRRLDQVLALGRAQLRKLRVAAGHQPFAGIILAGEADEIALVEQIGLQLPGIGEPGDGAALERGDPVHALHRAHGFDLDIRDHAAVPDHDERGDAEAVADLLNLRQQRFGIGGIALEHRNRNRAAARVREQTIVHLQRAGLALAAIADLGQRAGHALEARRGEVEDTRARPPSDGAWRGAFQSCPGARSASPSRRKVRLHARRRRRNPPRALCRPAKMISAAKLVVAKWRATRHNARVVQRRSA